MITTDQGLCKWRQRPKAHFPLPLWRQKIQGWQSLSVWCSRKAGGIFQTESRPLQRAVSLTDRAHRTAYDDQKRTTMPATARDNDSLASQMYKNLFGVSFLLLRIPHSDLEIAPISSLPCQGKIARKAAVPAVRQCWVLARRPLTSRSSTDPAWGWATTGGVKWPPRHSPGPTKEHAAGTSESQCFLGSTSCCLVQRLPMWFLCFPSPFAFDGKSFL